MFQSPGEIAFSIGNVDVYYYGMVMSLSIFLGISVILFLRKKFFSDISSQIIFDLSFLLIISGIIGARLYYVLLDYKYFLKFPFEIPAIWHGGISIQGAILGGIIAGAFYVKKHKLNFFRYADLFVFGLCFGQITGRWGNFFNSEAFGLPTGLPWKLFIPFDKRPIEYRNFDNFHPAFLYESILNAIIFCILYKMLKNKSKNGIIFFSYIILYSIARILVEAVRTDSVLNIYGIHIAHIVCILFILCSLIGIYCITHHKAANQEKC